MNQVKLVLGTMTFGESVFLPEAADMVKTFCDAGYDELDTAYVYNEGRSEEILGEMVPGPVEKCRVSTKVHPRISGKLDDQAVLHQLNGSLERLHLKKVHTFYLHFPDPVTPVISALRTCQELYEQGKFEQLGLSNFPAWLVAEVWHTCEKHHWVRPTVYQGVYNPLSRNAETELDDCLNHFHMCFYAYNPLAGGMLTGRYPSYESRPTDGRFTHRRNYQDRYWKKSYFDAVQTLEKAVEPFGMSLVEASYRWLAFHSMLKGERGDAILVGASKIAHLEENMKTIRQGPLPGALVEKFEEAWSLCKADSPAYFRFYQAT